MSLEAKLNVVKNSIVKGKVGEFVFILGSSIVKGGSIKNSIHLNVKGKIIKFPGIKTDEKIDEKPVVYIEASTVPTLRANGVEVTLNSGEEDFPTEGFPKLDSKLESGRKYPNWESVVVMAQHIREGYILPNIAPKGEKATQPSITVLLAIWALVCGPEPLRLFYDSLAGGTDRIAPKLPESPGESNETAKAKSKRRKAEVLGQVAQSEKFERTPKGESKDFIPSLETLTFKFTLFVLTATRPPSDSYAEFNKRRAEAYQGIYSANILAVDLVKCMSSEVQKSFLIVNQAYPGLVNEMILSCHGGVKAELMTAGLTYTAQMTTFLGMGTFRHILAFISSVGETGTLTRLHVRIEVMTGLVKFTEMLESLGGLDADDLGLLYLRYGPERTQSSNWPDLAMAGAAYGVQQDATMKNHKMIRSQKDKATAYLCDLSSRYSVVDAVKNEEINDALVKKLYNLTGAISVSLDKFSQISKEELKSIRASLDD